ncbi:MAG: DNA-binding beta-propeller fold protein YncE [Saprospiraceae bacterium]
MEKDAPAGVSKQGESMAIADFYNHRILYFDGATWSSLGGKKGKAPGAFDYPTDVQILGDMIYVADAYNHRGQILDLEGNSVLVFGEEEEINAATGIFVTDDLIALTDFENDRVIIFNNEGKVLQRIEDPLHKPTDVMIDNGLMYTYHE